MTMDSQNQQQGNSCGKGCDWRSCCKFDPNYILNQVKLVLTDPKGCWSVIKEQPDTIADIYGKYFGVLAAISVIAMFIGQALIGTTIPFTNYNFHWPIVPGLIFTIVSFGTRLLGVYVMALILEFLAPKFNGSASRINAFKLVVYSSTPGLIGSIAGIVPTLGMLGALFGLYGIYIFLQGVGTMTNVPEDKKWPFIVVSVLCVILAMFVISMLTMPFIPHPPLPEIPNLDVNSLLKGLAK